MGITCSSACEGIGSKKINLNDEDHQTLGHKVRVAGRLVAIPIVRSDDKYMGSPTEGGNHPTNDFGVVIM